MTKLFEWLAPTYKIVEEKMCGKNYWMIYWKWMGVSRFFERWNTPETAKIRISELTGVEIKK
jgi:hypothetical protein